MAQRIDVPGMGVVEFPDEMNDDQIAAAIKKSMPPQLSGSEVAADVGKQALSAVPLAVEGMASGPAALLGLAGRGTNYLMNKYTPSLVSQEAQDEQERTKAIIEANRKGGISQYLPEPQSTPGKYARVVPQFAIQAAVAPGSVARNVVTGTTAGVTSEAARQATEGTAAEPYAAIAGALFGGGTAATIQGRSAARAATAPIPAVEQIRDAGRAGYRHPEVAAVEINPASLDTAATRISGHLHTEGFRANNTPQTFAAIEELRTVPGPSARVADVDSVRKNLGEIAREVNAIGRPTAEATAAGVALRQVDGYLANLRQPDLIAGNAQRASTILNEARQDWASAAKAGDIGARLTRAERQAARSGSGSNIDNAIRQKISAVLDVPSRSVGLRPEEIAQAERVVQGTTATNMLRKVGKLGFNDGLTLMAHALAAVPTAGASLAVGTIGTIARKIGEHMTEQNARRLEEMIRSRSAEAGRGRAMQARINAANPPPRQVDPRIAATVSALLAERQTQNAP